MKDLTWGSPLYFLCVFYTFFYPFFSIFFFFCGGVWGSTLIRRHAGAWHKLLLLWWWWWLEMEMGGGKWGGSGKARELGRELLWLLDIKCCWLPCFAFSFCWLGPGLSNTIFLHYYLLARDLATGCLLFLFLFLFLCWRVWLDFETLASQASCRHRVVRLESLRSGSLLGRQHLPPSPRLNKFRNYT